MEDLLGLWLLLLNVKELYFLVFFIFLLVLFIKSCMEKKIFIFYLIVKFF